MGYAGFGGVVSQDRSFPLPFPKIIGYDVGMRYLLLIVAVSSLGFSADNPELMKIQQEVRDKCSAAQDVALAKLIDYRKREFSRVDVPDLPKDPKKSEIERRNIILSINSFQDNFDQTIIRGKGNGYVNYSELFQEVLNADEVRRSMIAMGIQTKQESEKGLDVITTAPKPKEKKKITATLADGTKVE